MVEESPSGLTSKLGTTVLVGVGALLALGVVAIVILNIVDRRHHARMHQRLEALNNLAPTHRALYTAMVGIEVDFLAGELQKPYGVFPAKPTTIDLEKSPWLREYKFRVVHSRSDPDCWVVAEHESGERVFLLQYPMLNVDDVGPQTDDLRGLNDYVVRAQVIHKPPED